MVFYACKRTAQARFGDGKNACGYLFCQQQIMPKRILGVNMHFDGDYNAVSFRI